jgi:protoporphyrinogen oxidase
MRELVRGLTPPVTPSVRKAAESLKYRDFLTVMLIVRANDAFADNWIYIHDPSVKVGRIQNFRSWSPEMVPEPDKACYGLEYFCFEHDGLWDSSDEELIELAKRELVQIGLAKSGDVVDGCVVRQKKAYPVYDDDYARHVATIRDELEERYPNLHLVGRNGMHKYNNQDHAMMTAMLCVENILAEEKLYDLWQVNGDAEYHESGDAPEREHGSAIRLVPMRVPAAAELASE